MDACDKYLWPETRFELVGPRATLTASVPYFLFFLSCLILIILWPVPFLVQSQ